MHPDYYLGTEGQVPHRSEVKEPHNPYEQPLAYPDYTSYSEPARYEEPQLNAYRGPNSLSEYNDQLEREARRAENRDEGARTRRSGLVGGGTALALGALLLKFGGFGISAIFSIAVYSFLFGWRFALGLVALLFIHEMGHALVMKLKGIPVGAMIFIPMLGAAVTMQQIPQNAKDEAEVGIAGPIAGALASSVCLIIAQMPGVHPVWAPLAYFGFFMNLFNLIPIVPFDGGRVLAAIDRRVWIIGFLGLLGFQIWSWLNGSFSPWLLLFVVMAATQFWSRRSEPDTPEARAYYSVPLGARIILSLLYFGLAGVLVLGMTISHGLIPGMQ